MSDTVITTWCWRVCFVLLTPPLINAYIEHLRWETLVICSSLGAVRGIILATSDMESRKG